MQTSSDAYAQSQQQLTAASDFKTQILRTPSIAIGLLQEFVSDIFRYREYLKQSVARDLRRRYKRSVLGYAWSMLNPLLMMTILAVVFSSLMRQNIENYAVFLFCGMLPYNYFNQTCLGCLGTIRANAKIIEQVAVPKYIFPLSMGISGLVDFLLSLLPLVLVMYVCGTPLQTSVIVLPILIIPLFCVTMGLSLIIAVSNVFFEDTQHLVDVVLRALYFLCPILYSKELLPEWLQPWVVLNPMFGQIEFMREIFYYGTIPDFIPWLINSTACLIILIIGLAVFRRSEKKFVYFM